MHAWYSLSKIGASGPDCDRVLTQSEVAAVYADHPDQQAIHDKITGLFLRRYLTGTPAVACIAGLRTNESHP